MFFSQAASEDAKHRRHGSLLDTAAGTANAHIQLPGKSSIEQSPIIKPLTPNALHCQVVTSNANKHLPASITPAYGHSPQTYQRTLVSTSNSTPSKKRAYDETECETDPSVPGSHKKPLNGGSTFTGLTSAANGMAQAIVASSSAASTPFAHMSLVAGTQLTLSGAPEKLPTPVTNPTPHRQGPNGLHKAHFRRRQWTSTDFFSGMIVTAGHHVTAQDLAADPVLGDNFVQTKAAKVCSKRRMFVVLWAYEFEAIYALPIYGHGINGLKYVDTNLLPCHICLKSYDDLFFVNQSSSNHPAKVKMFNGDIGANSSIDIQGGHPLLINEDISLVGYLTDGAAQYVLDRWHEEKNRAMAFTGR